MKHVAHLLIFIFSLLVNVTLGQNVTPEHKDSLNVIIDDYYQLNVRVFQAGSTVADIDAIFSLFTDDFEYVHPKYGGSYSRQVLYDGYVNNQKNGRYDGSVVDIKELRRIVGLNAVVTEKVFVSKEAGEIVEGEPQMTLFEIRGGKISRIMEYW